MVFQRPLFKRLSIPVFGREIPINVNTIGIDINRNFPTKDWYKNALRQWNMKYHKNKRYDPGKKPASEQETMFQMALIKRFKPQKILTLHSPLNFFDYDGHSSILIISNTGWK